MKLSYETGPPWVCACTVHNTIGYNMDFSKAFDIVTHGILSAKLAAPRESSQVVDWVRSFLENQSFQVCIYVVVFKELGIFSRVHQEYVTNVTSYDERPPS